MRGGTVVGYGRLCVVHWWGKWLCRSHTMQYRWDYYKLEYHWGVRVCCSYCMHITAVYSTPTCSSHCRTASYIWDLRSRSEESGCVLYSTLQTKNMENKLLQPNINTCSNIMGHRTLFPKILSLAVCGNRQWICVRQRAVYMVIRTVYIATVATHNRASSYKQWHPLAKVKTCKTKLCTSTCYCLYHAI